jgi:hypothetical protein
MIFLFLIGRCRLGKNLSPQGNYCNLCLCLEVDVFDLPPSPGKSKKRSSVTSVPRAKRAVNQCLKTNELISKIIS